MKLIQHYLLVLFILLLCNTLASCNQRSSFEGASMGSYRQAAKSAGDFNPGSFESDGIMEEETEEMADESTYADAPSSTSASNSIATNTAKSPAKKIIKNADVGYQVADITEARSQTNALVTKHQAYISEETQNNQGNRANHNFTIRVPYERFDSLLSDLLTIATFVEYKNVSARDVTEEFVDIQARLKTKRALEKRYLEILQSADSVKDMLTVEKQLQIVREDIESKEGRLKYLSDQASQSTIRLNTYKLTPRTPSPELNFLSRIKFAFQNGWQELLEFAVVIVAIWPFILLFFGFLMLISWLLRRRRRRKLREKV